MSRKTVEILGVNVDSITFEEALKKAENLVKTEGVSMIFTPNPEIIMCAKNDDEMRDILNSADICTADGIGVVYGSRILGTPVPERVAGFDLVCALLETLAKSGEGVFLFGAKPGVAEAAKAKMEEKYPGICVAGCHHGYFKPEDEDDIVQKINSSGAKLLLVCLGAPKQEKWIAKNLEKLNVPISIGAGGSLDVLAGEVERAPEIYQKLCIEWLYRALKEPKKRLPRIMKLPLFMIDVILNGRKYK